MKAHITLKTKDSVGFKIKKLDFNGNVFVTKDMNKLIEIYENGELCYMFNPNEIISIEFENWEE